MTSTHWTQRSSEDFLYSIASSFIEDLREKMEARGMTKSRLAELAKVHKSLVTRMFKNPGNLSLETMVRFARCVGLKVAIVPYEDALDPDNDRGPVDSSIFRWCWEHADSPRDMWDVEEIKTKMVATTSVYFDTNVFVQHALESGLYSYSILQGNTLPDRKLCVTAGTARIVVEKMLGSALSGTAVNGSDDKIAA
jgi:transcriptional regulator with XRE-family HTH domain